MILTTSFYDIKQNILTKKAKQKQKQKQKQNKNKNKTKTKQNPKKPLFPKLQLIPILRLQVIHGLCEMHGEVGIAPRLLCTVGLLSTRIS